jgi:predicted nucleic acid-binding protein
VIVVDASVVAPALADDGADGDTARGRLRGQTLVAPEIVDLEVLSVIRRAHLAGRLDERRAALALEDLLALDLRRVAHRRLLQQAWAHRTNLSVYDAAYVALAELLDVVLVTADERLASAPGLGCRVEVLG